MSWGGSVLGMIQSLRNNKRRRPNLIEGFDRKFNRIPKSNFEIKAKKIRQMTPEERNKLRKRIALERKFKTKKGILALAISVVLLLALIWVFITVLPKLNELYEMRGKPFVE